MKKFYGHLLVTFFFLFIFISFPFMLHAQVIPPDTGCDPLDPGCPIDGGLVLLLAAGAGYGLKRLRNSPKKAASGV